MRFLAKISFPVEIGNAMAKDGTLGAKIEEILKEQKPEAVYFSLENGERTAFIIIHLDDPSQIPAFAEPWFLTFNASIDAQPAMVPDDLRKAGPAIAEAAKKYA